MSAVERPEAEALDDHDRLELAEARLDLVDERVAYVVDVVEHDRRPQLDPVAQRQRDTITALVVAFVALVAAATVVGWRLSEALEAVLS